MNSSVLDIPLQNFAYLLALIVPVIFIQMRWKLNTGKSLYALGRMLFQLLAIGYVLAYIFEAENAAMVLGVLTLMLVAATWISLNPLKSPARSLYFAALVGILTSGILILLVVTQGVLQITPWYSPRMLVPLAGMTFTGGMTAISLSGERMISELKQGASYEQARAGAFGASLIPAINGLFAVGLASIPGMMTGQILSGISPLIAVKYQIVIMVMLFSSAGISTAIFLVLGKKYFQSMNSHSAPKGA